MTEIPTWKVLVLILGGILVIPFVYFFNRRNDMPRDLDRHLIRDMIDRNAPRKR